VVSVTDPYGRNLGFRDWSRYFSSRKKKNDMIILAEGKMNYVAAASTEVCSYSSLDAGKQPEVTPKH
jgi:hypothetical protein